MDKPQHNGMKQWNLHTHMCKEMKKGFYNPLSPLFVEHFLAMSSGSNQSKCFLVFVAWLLTNFWLPFKKKRTYIYTHAYICSGCYSRNNLYALTIENYFLLSTCVYGKGIWWDAKTWWRIFLLLLHNHFKMRLFMLIHFFAEMIRQHFD